MPFTKQLDFNEHRKMIKYVFNGFLADISIFQWYDIETNEWEAPVLSWSSGGNGWTQSNHLDYFDAYQDALHEFEILLNQHLFVKS